MKCQKMVKVFPIDVLVYAQPKKRTWNIHHQELESKKFDFVFLNKLLQLITQLSEKLLINGWRLIG